MPRQLVAMLREISADLSGLGETAAQHAMQTRASALSITLEAVKAGLPPGKLRDTAQQIRQDAMRHAERIGHDRARISLRVGQAIARATTLAREADVLGPTQQRAALLAGALWHAAREVRHHEPAPYLAGIERRPGRLKTARACVVRGVPGVEVPVEGRLLVARLRWEALRGPFFRADAMGWMKALTDASGTAPVSPRLDPAAARVWLVAGDRVLASSHAEEVPDVVLDPDKEAEVVEVGRRRVGIARVPGLIDGLDGWQVITATTPRLAAARPSRRRGDVIPFPGMA